jgi:hypothetical protein
VTPKSRVNCHFLLPLVSKYMTFMLAPERDMDAYQFDDMDDRPGYYKKTPIRYPVHLNAMIYRFYVIFPKEVRIIAFLTWRIIVATYIF